MSKIQRTRKFAAKISALPTLDSLDRQGFRLIEVDASLVLAIARFIPPRGMFFLFSRFRAGRNLAGTNNGHVCAEGLQQAGLTCAEEARLAVGSSVQEYLPAVFPSFVFLNLEPRSAGYRQG